MKRQCGAKNYIPIYRALEELGQTKGKKTNAYSKTFLVNLTS